jgi:hypothetical protein
MNRCDFTSRLFLAAVAAAIVAGPRAAGAKDATPVRVIFDTDLGSDVDDAGTVAVLHALADAGEAEILAMGLSVKHPWSAPCLDALNTYYGRPNIPIGALKGPGVDDGCKYAERIAAEFPHDLKSADDAPDVTAVYREVLARQPDKSVVLVTVGFLTNVANLLDSEPDSYSTLDGVELVRQKVRCWVCMGGGFPNGHEYNLMKDSKTTLQALEKWPTPIVFTGFEIGEPIQTGAGLKATPAANPIRRAYELYNGLNNRSSWDQTAVLYAVRGLDGGMADVWDIHAGGQIVMSPDGSNRWADTPDGKHSYLVRKLPSEKVAEIIAKLMEQPPKQAAK